MSVAIATPRGRAPVGWYYIYFYGTEDGTEVKIGHTKQAPTSRRVQHENQNGHDVPMRTLAVVLGQLSDESVLKRHFKPRRSRQRSSEWFRADDDMRDYLRWLRQQTFVATDETSMLDMHPVDASRWLPETGRAKSPRQLSLGVVDVWANLELNHVTEGDYYTDGRLIEPARRALGGITLNPASCLLANSVVQADEFYAFHQDGLTQDWRGTVWLNPPFGNWGDWTPKTLAEWHSGRVEAMCVLATSRVSTAHSFHPIVREADAVFITKGRIPFWGPHATSTPDEGHLIFYFGPDVPAFREAFEEIGTVFQGIR